MSILFHVQTKTRLTHRKILKEWLNQLTHEHHQKIGSVNIILVDDEALLQLNREALAHDYYTDIITFDFSTPGFISGDLYISIDRIRENARKFAVPEKIELYRVIVHGVLHLLGYKDKSEDDKITMRAAEDRYLQKLSKLFHVEH